MQLAPNMKQQQQIPHWATAALNESIVCCPGDQAKAVRRRKEEEVAAAQMEVALGRGEGASWGFGEDAVVDEDEEGVADVDWRTFSETRGLTDKQVRGCPPHLATTKHVAFELM